MNEPNDTVSSRRSVGACLMPAALSYLSLHTLFLAPVSPLSAHHLFATQIGIGAFKKAAERKDCRWPGHMVNEATETQRSLQWTINEKTYPYSLARLFHLSLSFFFVSLTSLLLAVHFQCKKKLGLPTREGQISSCVCNPGLTLSISHQRLLDQHFSSLFTSLESSFPPGHFLSLLEKLFR